MEYYLKALNSKPYLHDKVEFEIIKLCYDFDKNAKLKKYYRKKLDFLEINNEKSQYYTFMNEFEKKELFLKIFN